jgi:hypothetical protein
MGPQAMAAPAEQKIQGIEPRHSSACDFHGLPVLNVTFYCQTGSRERDPLRSVIGRGAPCAELRLARDRASFPRMGVAVFRGCRVP